VASEFAKHGIRERNFGVGASGSELDELLGMLDGKIAEEESIDQGEDGGVGTDAESERKNGDGGEPGVLGQDAEGVAQRLQQSCDGNRSWVIGLGITFQKYSNWVEESSSDIGCRRKSTD
jgi:hypothetical protein